MKLSVIIFLIIISISCGSSQNKDLNKEVNKYSDNKDSIEKPLKIDEKKVLINRLSKIEWNKENGLKTYEIDGSIESFRDYCLISSNKLAFLSTEGPAKILFLNLENNQWETPIEVIIPEHITFMKSNNHIFLLNYENISEYTLDGKLFKTYDINDKFEYITHITAIDSSLFIIIADQECFKIIDHAQYLNVNKQIESKLSGIPFSDKRQGKIIISKNQINLKIYEEEYEVKNYKIETFNCIGGDFIGKIDNYYVLVCDFINGNSKLGISSEMIFINENTKTNKSIDLPRIYYININKTVNYKTLDNNLYHFVNTLDNCQLFEIKMVSDLKKDSISNELYPQDLNYEFNYYNQ